MLKWDGGRKPMRVNKKGTQNVSHNLMFLDLLSKREQVSHGIKGRSGIPQIASCILS